MRSGVGRRGRGPGRRPAPRSAAARTRSSRRTASRPAAAATRIGARTGPRPHATVRAHASTRKPIARMASVSAARRRRCVVQATHWTVPGREPDRRHDPELCLARTTPRRAMSLTWDDLRARGMPWLALPHPRSPSPVRSLPRDGSASRAAFKAHRTMELHGGDSKDTGCGLSEAKGTCAAPREGKGECHWCRGAIPVAELVDCPRCEALNIVLEAAPSP